jgi:hypothetical protein
MPSRIFLPRKEREKGREGDLASLTHGDKTRRSHLMARARYRPRKSGRGTRSTRSGPYKEEWGAAVLSRCKSTLDNSGRRSGMPPRSTRRPRPRAAPDQLPIHEYYGCKSQLTRSGPFRTAGRVHERSEWERPALLVAQDLESKQVLRNREFRHAFHRVRVTRVPRTAHVAEESFHGREIALDVNEDRAIRPVRNTADQAMPERRLRDSRAVIHALNATARDAIPVDN